jgi:hypothetical protein
LFLPFDILFPNWITEPPYRPLLDCLKIRLGPYGYGGITEGRVLVHWAGRLEEKVRLGVRERLRKAVVIDGGRDVDGLAKRPAIGASV